MKTSEPSVDHSRQYGAALIALGVIIALAIGAVFILNKDVTLVVDGETRQLSTYALTVGGLLKAENISTSNADQVQPALKTWLRDDATITLDHAVPVQIYADGVLHHLLTAERIPARLLALAGVSLLPGDRLSSEGLALAPDTVLSGAVQAISIQVIRSTPFTLQQASQRQNLTSTAATLGQALWNAGVNLQATDHLRPALHTPLSAGLEASLVRADMLTIKTAAGEITLLTAADTVGAALAEAGLALQGLDYSLPAAEQPVPTDRQVRLVRVWEEVIIENTPLEFETTYEAAPDLELDSQSILQTGEYGLTAQRVRVRYEDGQEIVRQVEEAWVARPPQPRIVGYGTNIVKHTLDTPDGTIYYYRALTMWATSYCPADVGGSTTTASGKTLEKGLVGINPAYIPYGTLMYVPGYGYAEAADTGLIGPRWIDLGYSDDDYVAWHQYVTVYFLWPPPAQILWIYP